MQSLGAVIGTSVSGVFLLMMAAINLIVLADVYKTWRRVARGGEYDERSLNDYLNRRGLLARAFRPLLALVRHSGQMYLIGLLFGLGFDTASEVGILGMSATAGAGDMPAYFILLLPLLFVAGMALVDTTDGVAMLGAYGWAYVRPIRKLYYNLNITLLSVLIALGIGGIEVCSVIRSETGITAGPFGWAAGVDLGDLGYAIIVAFLAGWLLSVVVYRVRGIGRLDEALTHAVSASARDH
jgi:high-affinity nickel-transport protein